MKNLSKVLALVLVVAMVFSFAVSASAKTSFKDDASIKYEEAVELLSALKVINGYTDGTFKPTGNITRGEFAVMVSYMVANDWSEIPLYSDIKQLGKDYAPYCTFADTKNHWSAGYVAYCAGNGYISGRNANVFDPDATITAAEISVILLRVMGYDATIENFGTTSGTTKGYATQLTARNAGLLNGLDTMNFWAAATREQAAQLMFNALKGNVVTYGNTAFTLDWSTGRVIVSNLNNAKAVQSTATLMHYCFNRVACIGAQTIDGYAGHQWIAYTAAVNANENLNIIAAKLTDVYRDDSTIATYVGGTAYSKIAKDLGITSKNVVKAATVFVNGAEVTDMASAPFALPTNLVNLYMQGTSGASLPDNCRLEVVKNPDRAQVGTSYKLLYYYELVAELTDIVKITDRKDPHYGEFAYGFTYYWEYPYGTALYNKDTKTGGKTIRYAFAATDKAYSDEVYYLVEPNDSGVAQPSANIDVVEDYQDFLSIKVAKTEAPVSFNNGRYSTFSRNVGFSVSDGKSNYNVSLYAHDFVNVADYNKNMTLIYNTAGYVQGFAPYTNPTNVADAGYLYVDSLEFAVTATEKSSLIATQTATINAQAKALVYKPTEAGNSKPDVIDLRIVETPAQLTYGFVDVAVANNGVLDLVGAPDTFVTKTQILLPRDTTNGFCDSPMRQYAHYQAGNIRVYDRTFDGWYAYTQYKDGKYSLRPVRVDEVTTKKGYANVDPYGKLIVDGKEITGYTLTSGTTNNIFTMDLSTMTATKTPVVGYKNMYTGTHGGFAPATSPVDGAVYVPYIGRVGGEIALNTRISTITVVNEFNVATPANGLRYALYRGTNGYFTNPGQYRLQFLGAGVKNALFAAPTVKFVDVDGTESKLDPEQLRKKLVKADPANEENFVYALTLDADNNILAVKALKLYKGEKVDLLDPDGYVRIDGVAYNYDTTEVWNFNTGKADAVATGDTVFYFDAPAGNEDEISVLWLLHAGVAPVSDPRFEAPYVPTPWIWWTK